MFIIRGAKGEDVGTLLKLAKMVHFINLPADKDIIEEKVVWSRACFARAGAAAGGGEGTARHASKPGSNGRVRGGEAARGAGGGGASGAPSGLRNLTRESDLFMFVMEDTESGGLLGTSQVIAKMGGPGRPNLSFQLSKREMFSQALQYGARHTIATLVLDETGPTELGGLILQPSYRGHKMKLGRFLSLIRFHFIGRQRPLFSARLIAEMAGPLTSDGRNVFWEHLGRRFINLPYAEADKFCQYSREFMLSLLPREEIYLSLLPPEATCVVGEVGEETIPARRLLERLGFRYRDRIDPFDGGPHLEAETDQVPLVRDTRGVVLGEPIADGAGKARGMVSVLHDDGEFRCVETAYTEDRAGRLRLPREMIGVLLAEPGATAGLTPMPSDAPVPKPKPQSDESRTDAPGAGGSGGRTRRRGVRKGGAS